MEHVPYFHTTPLFAYEMPRRELEERFTMSSLITEVHVDSAESEPSKVPPKSSFRWGPDWQSQGVIGIMSVKIWNSAFLPSITRLLDGGSH